MPTSLSQDLIAIKPYVLKWMKTASGLGYQINVIFLIPQTGVRETPYAKTGAGLDAATAAAVAGDAIWIPPGTYASDHSLKAGVEYFGLSQQETILTGKITLGDGTTLRNLAVIRTANDGNSLIGVVGPATGTGYLFDVMVDVDQAGAGAAYGVEVSASGNIDAHRCIVRSDSVGGSGYAGHATSGYMYIFHGSWRGSTDRFLVE